MILLDIKSPKGFKDEIKCKEVKILRVGVGLVLEDFPSSHHWEDQKILREEGGG